NGPVVWGFFGAPLNDVNPNDTVLLPFSTGAGGTFSSKWCAPEGNATTLTAQLTNILNGHAYINFHTTQFPSGEIRGMIGTNCGGGGVFKNLSGSYTSIPGAAHDLGAQT